MNIVDRLVEFLQKKETTKQESPEGICPNCWGKQEYAGKFYDAVKVNNLDVNSLDSSIGWIQDYANKYLLDMDIQLISDKEGVVCKNCKIAYKPAEV